MTAVDNPLPQIMNTPNPLIINTPRVREHVLYWGAIFIIRKLGVFSVFGEGVTTAARIIISTLWVMLIVAIPVVLRSFTKTVAINNSLTLVLAAILEWIGYDA